MNRNRARALSPVGRDAAANNVVRQYVRETATELCDTDNTNVEQKANQAAYENSPKLVSEAFLLTSLNVLLMCGHHDLRMEENDLPVEFSSICSIVWTIIMCASVALLDYNPATTQAVLAWYSCVQTCLLLYFVTSGISFIQSLCTQWFQTLPKFLEWFGTIKTWLESVVDPKSTDSTDAYMNKTDTDIMAMSSVIEMSHFMSVLLFFHILALVHLWKTSDKKFTASETEATVLLWATMYFNAVPRDETEAICKPTSVWTMRIWQIACLWGIFLQRQNRYDGDVDLLYMDCTMVCVLALIFGWVYLRCAYIDKLRQKRYTTKCKTGVVCANHQAFDKQEKNPFAILNGKFSWLVCFVLATCMLPGLLLLVFGSNLVSKSINSATSGGNDTYHVGIALIGSICWSPSHTQFWMQVLLNLHHIRDVFSRYHQGGKLFGMKIEDRVFIHTFGHILPRVQ